MSYSPKIVIELHGELQDYNILSEMLSSDKDKMYLEEELKTLRKDNASDSERIELIYNRRRDAERQVAELEEKIEEERNKAHHIIESLNPQLRERYVAFQAQNSGLQSESGSNFYGTLIFPLSLFLNACLFCSGTTPANLG